jgi:hypothetical protein
MTELVAPVGARQNPNDGRVAEACWIPAFAGMTDAVAEMTDAGMTDAVAVRCLVGGRRLEAGLPVRS